MDEFGKIIEHSVPKEHVPLSDEHRVGNESFQSIELNFLPEEYNQEGKQKKKQHKSKDRKNLLRKMGYMLASAVAIVSLAQTVEPSKGILVDVSGYDGQIKSANGGVIPIRYGDVGLITYEGEQIAGDMQMYDLVCEPNKNGYSLWEDRAEHEIVVFNAKGKIVSKLGVSELNVHDFIINDDDIISYRVIENYESRPVFCDLDGTIIRECRLEDFNGKGDISYVSMRDGKAFVYTTLGGFRERQGTSLIMQDGSKQDIATHTRGDEADFLSEPIGGYSKEDGYYVGKRPITTLWGDLDAGVSWRLINGETGEQYARVKRVSRKVFVEHTLEEYVTQLDERYNDWYCLAAKDIKSYLDENVPMYHYKTYGCLSMFDEDDKLHKDVLFDYLNETIHDTIIEEAIAVYDEIIFDNYDYLAVRDGDAYFYIDLQGEKVSKNYAKATAFNSQGYALVMKKSGVAELIDSNFRTLDTIKGVTDIQSNGEAFLVTIEDKLYSYYYGK